MSEKTAYTIAIGFFLVCIAVCLVSCHRSFSEQGITRSYGGTMPVYLEPNRKLVEITWKDANLWYLTREMKPEEEAEDYIFEEKDVTGWMEGTVIIHERKMSEEEYQEYLETKCLEEDYYREGNFTYDENTGETKEVFITWDPDTGEYRKIRDYTVDEYGVLVYRVAEE